MPSDLAANSFRGAANATRNAIDRHSDFVANLSGGAANSTQTLLIHLLLYMQVNFVELLIQLKTELMIILI
jgi:hypothetical protein